MSQATSKFEWRVQVPERLIKGDIFNRWDDDTGVYEPNCLFRVDEYGFFIYWQSEGHDGKVIELSQVSDVRLGKAPNDRKIAADLMADTLIFGRGNIDERTVTICSGLDLVNIVHTNISAPDNETAQSWIEGLNKLIHNIKANNICPMTALLKYWMKLKFLTNANGKLPVRNITRTFASGKAEKIVFQILKEMKLPHNKNDEIEPVDFSFERFYYLYNKVCPRNDIKELFKKCSKGKEYITAHGLMKFLNETQRDSRLNEILVPYYDENRVLKIINCYETDAKLREKNLMGADGFYRYLMSDENAVMYLDKLEIYQNLDQPLAHYLINSSHNTYLTGRQFGGKSSVEMYRQVLLSGCRCIELDCWDGKDQEPIITHGKAMCTDILFKDALVAIRETAFVTSEYPVILSFENHCSINQQEKIAKYCEEIFGDLLLTKPLPTHPLKENVPLPSPNLLKRKILIKNKKLKPEIEEKQLELLRCGKMDVSKAILDTTDEEAESSMSENHKALDEAHPEFVEINENRKVSIPFIQAKEVLSKEEEEALVNNYTYTGATRNVHPLLSALVVYCQAVKFSSFDESERGKIHFHMSSFSETVGFQHLKNNSIEMVNYNKRQLTRIYPRGGRVDSSNYMPQIFWNAGCQMVSLNFQTPDLAMQLNMGKFEYNGNCGYLLKPDFMRRQNRFFNPNVESSVDGVIGAHCSVKVISGQFLSDKKVGTYVEVDMFGLPSDTIRKEFKTRIVPGNGLNPVYNEDPFVFRKIVLPDLAVLRFGVYEETGKLIGQRILPFEVLQAGYRHISLRTEGNYPLALSTIFCLIVLKTYVPDGLGDFVNALNNPCRNLITDELLSPEYDRKNKWKERLLKPRDNFAEIKDQLRHDLKMEALKRSKRFQKLITKQNKDMDNLKKKHRKDQSLMQHQHVVAIEKLLVAFIKENTQLNAATNTVKKRNKVVELINEQEKEWTDLIQQQQKELSDLRSSNIQQQMETLRLSVVDVQLHQIQLIEKRQDRETKDLKSSQVKQSMEETKNIMNNRTIRNKAERERRIRELNSNNTKRFIEERKRLKMKHDREMDNLRKIHQEEELTLMHETKKVLEMCEKNSEEFFQSKAPSSCV